MREQRKNSLGCAVTILLLVVAPSVWIQQRRTARISEVSGFAQRIAARITSPTDGASLLGESTWRWKYGLCSKASVSSVNCDFFGIYAVATINTTRQSQNLREHYSFDRSSVTRWSEGTGLSAHGSLPDFGLTMRLLPPP